MKRYFVVLLTIFLLSIFADSALARERTSVSQTPPVQTQLLACNQICDAGWFGGYPPLAYLRKDVHDVQDIDIKVGGLAPTSIAGKAWTAANDGHNTGLNADMLDGRHKGYFTTKINTLNARNKKLNRRVTVLSIRQVRLTRRITALEALLP